VRGEDRHEQDEAGFSFPSCIRVMRRLAAGIPVSRARSMAARQAGSVMISFPNNALFRAMGSTSCTRKYSVCTSWGKKLNSG
jgi:hypothetical protein